MATSSNKLAASLEALNQLQDQVAIAIRSGQLSRTHRERLLNAGFIEEVVKGWYVPARSDGNPPVLSGAQKWKMVMRPLPASAWA
jgi:hypothetical protein